MEELEARILRGFFRNGHGFAMLRDPSGNSLPTWSFRRSDDFGMRVFGSPQYQFIAFKNVDKTGVALYQCGSKFNDSVGGLREIRPLFSGER